MMTPKNQNGFIGSFNTTLKRRFRNSNFCVGSALIVATVFAFFLTGVHGIPIASEHDEFSYLLGADTFASMRTSNPTHPMWHHFETFHVIHKPTYASKYPPAQSLTLAVGQLMGHPIIGACLATGFSIAALVWMLTGWLPRRYYWLAWLMVVFHPGLQIAWGQSYWGGAVALSGASLLLGAFARLTRIFQIRYSVIAASGVILLAFSRPFEGVVLTASVIIVLIWKLSSHSNWHVRPFLRRAVLPSSIVLFCGVLCMLGYNRRVTGDAFVAPYRVHESIYGWNPLFVWQQSNGSPNYRHEDLRRHHQQDAEKIASTFGTAGDVFSKKSEVAFGLIRFFWGGAAIVAALGLPFVFRQPRYRLAFVILMPPFIASLVTPWANTHYCAPACPLLILIFVGSLIALWNRTRRHPFLQFAILIAVPILQLISFSTIYLATENQQRYCWSHQRVAVIQQLREQAGTDLVIVRYDERHDPHQEWVYNDADIDGSEVVWARNLERKERRELIEYFSDRNVWIIEPDSPNPQLKRLKND